MNTKSLYIIAGCNGAGKTTASFTILPEILHCDQFVNADEIAKGLSPFKPESVSFEAGRIMLSRIEQLFAEDQSFAIETTLATKIYRNKIREARGKGYEVVLLFFWLQSVEMAIDRVRTRVSEGGHNIPEDVIIRRFFSGIRNLFDIYIDIVDQLVIFDNSNLNATIISEKLFSSKLLIHNSIIFNQLLNFKNGSP
ncbi:MAG: zeta toxin family protein [Saprospiraceae bacterium]|jgi:predicted ABC-type ATPase|nr:zeta toxin family protein [Saprospiraceae bacterium]